ncbi:glycosyltransferase [Nitrospira calida]|jgi:glycosyltransferase involved in cell wall biosynthesis
MPEIRLLEVRNTYKWGGGPDKTILLSASLHNRDRVVPVVAYIRDVRDRDFAITRKARELGLTYYEIPERGKFDPSVLLTLRKLIVKHDINLVHPHDYKSDLFCYLVSRLLRKRPLALISTAHNWAMMGLRGELYRRLDLFVMRYFDHLIAVSDATKSAMVNAGLPSEKITVIHNAVDTTVWAPRVANTFRSEFGLEGVFPLIGYVGRITEEKNLKMWLRVAANIAQRYPEARFVIVGDGASPRLHTELQKLATALNIADRVVFTGYRQDLQNVYAALDVFFMTSCREGLSNSILEAMAMGLPVVATDVGGTRELIENGNSGYLLPVGDSTGMTEALINLLGDPCLRTQMAMAARKRTEERFSFQLRLRRIEALYEQLVREKISAMNLGETAHLRA